jgi:2-methylisocitrate lyase-like PEP mutase family enzyme
MTTANQLRVLLQQQQDILPMPCVYDGLTARLVERAGFPLTFMTGFGVAAARGYPDTQLVSYGEMVESAREICESLRRIPCVGDGDTGYGNAVNVKRTVRGYAQVGLAGIMIEDQVQPKRCGHTKGKAVVSRAEAEARLAAALDARAEGADLVIIARTDARAVAGMEEALARCQRFAEMGADITFLEAPRSVEEMERYCREVPGPKLANMLEMGQTPILPRQQLWEMGYAIAAYPLTLLSAGLKAMQEALQHLEQDRPADNLLLSFDELKSQVGFDDYYREEERYRI